MGFHVVKCPLEGLSGAFGGKSALLAPDRNPTRFPEEPISCIDSHSGHLTRISPWFWGIASCRSHPVQSMIRLPFTVRIVAGKWGRRAFCDKRTCETLRLHLRRPCFTALRRGRRARQAEFKPAADQGWMLSCHFPQFAKPVGDMSLHRGSEGSGLLHVLDLDTAFVGDGN